VTLGAGGEFGGIGSATHIWTWTARADSVLMAMR
jgi:hypothetical protein